MNMDQKLVIWMIIASLMAVAVGALRAEESARKAPEPRPPQVRTERPAPVSRQEAALDGSVERSFFLSDRGEIDLESPNATVEVMRGEGPSVQVSATFKGAGGTATMHQWAETARVRIEQEGDRVIARSDGHSFFFPWPPIDWASVNGIVRWRVVVPPSWQGTVKVAISNGTITVDGVNGKLELESSNAAVTVTGVRAQLEVETSNGTVTVRRSSLTGDSSIDTSNGRIDLEADLAESGRYRLETSNGTIYLRLVPWQRADLDLSTHNGRISLAEELKFEAQEVQRDRVRGLLNGGGPEVTAKTSNGGIYVTSSRW